MPNTYRGPERRAASHITDEQMEEIAEMAAERALEKVYGEVGKSVAKKLFWLIGAAAIGIVYFLGSKGITLK